MSFFGRLFGGDDRFVQDDFEQTAMPSFREVSFFRGAPDLEEPLTNFCRLTTSLFCYCVSCNIVVYDFVETTQRAVLSGHRLPIMSIEPFNDTTLISGSCDKSVRIWNLTDFTCSHSLDFHESPVTFLCSLDSKRVLSCAGAERSSVESYLGVWDVSGGRLLGKVLRGDVDEKIVSVLVLSPHRFVTSTPSMLHVYASKRSRKNAFTCVSEVKFGRKDRKPILWVKKIKRNQACVAASVSSASDREPEVGDSGSEAFDVPFFEDGSESASARKKAPSASAASKRRRKRRGRGGDDRDRGQRSRASDAKGRSGKNVASNLNSSSKILLLVGLRNGDIAVLSDILDPLYKIRAQHRLGPVTHLLHYSPSVLFRFYESVLVVYDIELKKELYRKKRMNGVRMAIVVEGSSMRSRRSRMLKMKASPSPKKGATTKKGPSAAAAAAAAAEARNEKRLSDPFGDATRHSPILVTSNGHFLLFWKVDPASFRLQPLGRLKVTLHTRPITQLFKLTNYLFLTYSEDCHCVLWNDVRFVERVKNKYSISFMLQ